jgi:hypothetical protein
VSTRLLRFARNDNSNVDLGGSVVVSGLTDNQLLWDFTSTGKNISLTNNGETFNGNILLPLDNWSMNNTVLDGRVWGGDGGNMQIVSGATINGPVPVPAPSIGHGLLVLLSVGDALFGGKFLERLKKRHLHSV